MKFISKSSNLLVVLRPGLSAQPLTGTPAKPTISVRFKDGVAEVTNQEMIDMMLEHPGFNGDFISADDVSRDPYAASRRPTEPVHVITELEHGTPVSRTVHGTPAPQTNPDLQKAVVDLATEMAKKIAPQMAKEMAKEMLPEMLKELVQVNKIVKAPSTKPKGKPGRKPKAQNKPVVQEEITQNTEEVTA